MEIQGVELEVWMGLVIAGLALAVWALKRYEKVMADGKVTIKEVIGTVEESEDLIDEVVEKAENLDAALKEAKATKAETESES